MSKILDLYDAKKDAPGLDNPQPKIIAGNKEKDQTPYSLGNGYAGDKDIDEAGVKAVEKRNAKGNRYQVGEFGGGYPNAKGYTDKNKYTSIMASKK
jgi:hypothetical protein